jgi:16S rRNA (uracil1498-N3)-methyltransferase
MKLLFFAESLFMALPFFYVQEIKNEKDIVVLDEETSRHIAQVLRMKPDEELLLTDGKGSRAKAIITNDHRKKCEVTIVSTEKESALVPKITIAISLIKNASRFEWFLEKATEIGVNEIIPLLCERTEKEKFRNDRLQNILISAMLQSQQSRLPALQPPTHFQEVIKHSTQLNKFIAHCLPGSRTSLSGAAGEKSESSIILIGPEGDFTEHEIETALHQNFKPVALGNTRLRTETAGIVAATLLRMK